MELLEVADALSRIPGWEGAGARWRRMAGGLTNRSWLVTVPEGGKYVLRLDAEPARDLGLDRRTELAIQERAAARGLAPAVVFADPDAGILVCEYLPGLPWTRRDLDERDRLEALATLLRAVHGLPLSGSGFDAPAIARRYVRVLKSRPAGRRPDDRALAAALRAIETAPPIEIRACCHNDVVVSNLIGAGRPWLLDWEYASDNDPFYDLACVIGYHGLDRPTADGLLEAYSGGARPEHRERLEVQSRIYQELEWLWFAVVGVESLS